MKTGDVQASVGSNPTPSASHAIRLPKARPRRSHSYGSLVSEVSNIKDRVKKIEEKQPPTPEMLLSRITKGTLCGQLIEALSHTSDVDRIKMLEGQLSKMDCYQGVAAAMERDNSVEDFGVENAVDNGSNDNSTLGHPL